MEMNGQLRIGRVYCKCLKMGNSLFICAGMKKYRYFLIFHILFGACLIFWSGNYSFCQTIRMDSLLSLLKTDKQANPKHYLADTTKVNHLCQLTRECELTGNLDDGLKYGKEALALAHQLNFKKGIAIANTNIGNIYLQNGDYDMALENYFASLKLVQSGSEGTLEWKKIAANTYSNIGIVHRNLGNYDKALENYFTALKIDKEIGDKKGTAGSYNNIGIIYWTQGNYDKALENHFASLKIKEEIGDKQGAAYSYNNIGIVYYNQGNYDKAFENLFASLKITEEIGDKYSIAASYNNIGNLYLTQSASALIPLPKRGELIAKAKEQVLLSLTIAKAIGSKKLIKTNYETLSLCDSDAAASPLTPLQKRGELWKSAYEYHKQFKQFHDSIFNEESSKQIAKIQTIYETEKKEIQIQMVETELEKQQLDKYLVIALFFFILLFLYFLFNRYRLKEQANRDKKQLELRQKEFEITRSELKALRAQMDPHFISNCITSIAQMIDTGKYEETQTYLYQFGKLMRSILDSSRQPTIYLAKEIVLLRLYCSLESLVKQNKFTFSINIDPKLDIESIEIPNMLIQPYVENAIKYGIMHKETGGFIEIRFEEQDTKLLCTITDNGIGIKKAKQLQAQSQRIDGHVSLGMQITSERLKVLNERNAGDKEGQIEIHIHDLENQQCNGIGTKVEICIPII